jgi:hypothetical protein
MPIELIGSTRSGWQVRSPNLKRTDKIVVQGTAAVKAMFEGNEN